MEKLGERRLRGREGCNGIFGETLGRGWVRDYADGWVSGNGEVG